MNLTFLGTGTSVGVPAIGCSCAVCRSRDPRNRRRRASLHVEHRGVHLVIDTPPDFREAVLTFRVPRLDAVLLTHAHADHIFGFDDIRRFNELQGERIPVYGSPGTLAAVGRIFRYVRLTAKPGLLYPRIDFKPVTRPFRVGGLRIEPVEVEHADLPVTGYILSANGRRVGYVPDCQAMSAAVLRRLHGVDVMILDALRHKPHPTHYSLAESVDMLRRIGAKRSFLTHMGHSLDYAATQAALPPRLFVPYDGLKLSL